MRADDRFRIAGSDIRQFLGSVGDPLLGKRYVPLAVDLTLEVSDSQGSLERGGDTGDMAFGPDDVGVGQVGQAEHLDPRGFDLTLELALSCRQLLHAPCGQSLEPGDNDLTIATEHAPRDVICHGSAAKLASAQASAGLRFDNGRAAREGSPSLCMVGVSHSTLDRKVEPNPSWLVVEASPIACYRPHSIPPEWGHFFNVTILERQHEHASNVLTKRPSNC
jgi:hypothetical protein